MRTHRDRYENDPTFRMLVDSMLHAIRELKTTPTEVREAAMVAQIMYELENPRPVFVDFGTRLGPYSNYIASMRRKAGLDSGEKE